MEGRKNEKEQQMYTFLHKENLLSSNYIFMEKYYQ